MGLSKWVKQETLKSLKPLFLAPTVLTQALTYRCSLELAVSDVMSLPQVLLRKRRRSDLQPSGAHHLYLVFFPLLLRPSMVIVVGWHRLARRHCCFSLPLLLFFLSLPLGLLLLLWAVSDEESGIADITRVSDGESEHGIQVKPN